MDTCNLMHCKANMTSSTIVEHTHTLNKPFPRTTRVRQYQKGKTNLDFTEARDSEWQWHQLGHMQVCTLLQTDNHARIPPLKFFTGRMPFNNSVKALKVHHPEYWKYISQCRRRRTEPWVMCTENQRCVCTQTNPLITVLCSHT